MLVFYQNVSSWRALRFPPIDLFIESVDHLEIIQKPTQIIETICTLLHKKKLMSN